MSMFRQILISMVLARCGADRARRRRTISPRPTRSMNKAHHGGPRADRRGRDRGGLPQRSRAPGCCAASFTRTCSRAWTAERRPTASAMVALDSLATCMGAIQHGDLREGCTQAYDYLAKTFYNDAAKALNDMDAERALQLYAKHQDATLQSGARLRFQGTRRRVRQRAGHRVHQALQPGPGGYQLVRQGRGHLPSRCSPWTRRTMARTTIWPRCTTTAASTTSRSITPENDIPSIQDIQRVSRSFFMQSPALHAEGLRDEPDA